MKKLILVMLVLCGGVATADTAATQATAQEQACFDLANKDSTFAKALLRVVDSRVDEEILNAHKDAAYHVQKNESHVIYAYAALWVIAAGFVVFLWRRQQALRGEIAQLRSDLAAAAKETT